MQTSEMTMSSNHSRGGFTLIDIMITMGVFAVVMATAVPALIDVAASMKLGNGQRQVEMELQNARLAAVSFNRPMRVKFNCPVNGQYRLLEVVGTPSLPAAADSAADRCSDTKYKFPANDTDPSTRPNHDGPVRHLPDGISFGGAPTLEFWPDGTVHKQVAAEKPWTQLPTTGASVAVKKGTSVKTITVNGLGKIQLVQ
jgi:Tfp pilus assembly protein FimT